MFVCLFQTWWWVIGPMVLYIFERVLRFIRYTQAVTYRKVRFELNLTFQLVWQTMRMLFKPLLSFSDCAASLQGAGAAADKERLQDGGGPVRFPQLPANLPAGVAPVHHDLRPRGGLLRCAHPLGRGLDR